MAVKRTQTQKKTQDQGAGADGAEDQDLRDDDLDEDDDLDDQGSDDDGDDEGDEDEQGDEDEDGFDPEAFEEGLLKKVESRLDRRINAVLREIRKGRDNGRQQRGDGSQPQRRQPQQPEVPAVDVRSVKIAYRDYIADEVKFVSREEREAAATLANGLIAQQIAAGGDDEDEIGSEVAKAVGETIRGLRKHYEERTKAALKRQGLLADAKGGQGGTAGKGRAPGMRSEMAKGATLAGQRHPTPNL